MQLRQHHIKREAPECRLVSQQTVQAKSRVPYGTEEAAVGRTDLVISLDMGCEEEERNKGDTRFCQGTCVHADVIPIQEEVGEE